MAGYIGAFMTKVFRLGKKRVSEDHTDGEERETKEEEEIEEDEDTVMPTEEAGSEDNEGGLIGDVEELDREATSFDESEDEVFENDKEGKTSTDVWVILEDFTATNDKELSVQKGQQVEVLDSAPGGSSEWCLVRMLNSANDGTSCSIQIEGRVPTATIKQVPAALTVSSSRSSIENDDSAPMNSSEAHTVSTPSASSPASKRKSSFRKWLSNPVRKRSQGRMEKTPDKPPTEPPHSGKVERKPSGSVKITAIKHARSTSTPLDVSCRVIDATDVRVTPVEEADNDLSLLV
ncbi:hypothetical protein LSAT2_003170 [Lamellibrachia satsuma]|nr:hypothetical protein LSAT2_003170 [Lamellibrachia satsuma]